MTTYVWDVGARRARGTLKDTQEFVVAAEDAVAAARAAKDVAPDWEITYLKRYAPIAEPEKR